MSIIYPIPLTDQILGAVDDIRGSIMPAHLPNCLYHYTREEGFQGIVKCRSLRATCAVSLNDKFEIRHGTDILRELTCACRLTSDGFVEPSSGGRQM